MKYNDIRRPARAVHIGRVTVGGNAPIAIQSMTNTDPHDVAATLSQIRALAAAGCDIVRLTVPDREAAEKTASGLWRMPAVPGISRSVSV